MIVHFRFHRDGLLESLNTSKFFSSEWEMMSYLDTFCDEGYLYKERYSDNPDTRIGWPFTCCVRVASSGRSYILGFYTIFGF